MSSHAEEVSAVRRTRESLEGVDIALQALTHQLQDLEAAYLRMEQANRGWARILGKPLPPAESGDPIDSKVSSKENSKRKVGRPRR